MVSEFWQLNPDSGEDLSSRMHNSGLQHSYGVDYRTLRWIYYFLDGHVSIFMDPNGLSYKRSRVDLLLDPPRGLGILSSLTANQSTHFWYPGLSEARFQGQHHGPMV